MKEGWLFLEPDVGEDEAEDIVEVDERLVSC